MTAPKNETVYLVTWPDRLIVKAGITSGRRRWMAFLARGAVLYRLAILDFADWRTALGYEAALHAHFRATCPFAFDTREESVELLGRLGGHCETYQLAVWQQLIDAPQPPDQARVWTARDYYRNPPLPAEVLA